MTTPDSESPRPDNRLVADLNEINILKLISAYGHIRRTEIARSVWQSSSARVATKMTQLTVRRLILKGQLLERPNALGGQSLVLAARGVARLREWGVDAQDGYELSSVSGPQFFHRTLGTCYLIERGALGHAHYGEYALMKGRSPVNRADLVAKFNKVPDGLVLVPGPERKYEASVSAADWIEVESSYKPEEEIERILAIAWRVGEGLNTAETVLLDRVIFVYDARHRHENMILGALKRYLDAHPIPHARALLASIVLVRCRIDAPLVCRSFEEIDCAQLLQPP